MYHTITVPVATISPLWDAQHRLACLHRRSNVNYFVRLYPAYLQQQDGLIMTYLLAVADIAVLYVLRILQMHS
jgi:hypothetical protein